MKFIETPPRAAIVADAQIRARDLERVIEHSREDMGVILAAFERSGKAKACGDIERVALQHRLRNRSVLVVPCMPESCCD